MARPAPLLLAALLAAAAWAAAWGAAEGAGGPHGLGEPHLVIVPRTAAEAGRIAAATAPPTDPSAPQRFEALPAGAATVRLRTDAEAFSLPGANLGFAGELDFRLGNGLFRRNWVSAPASTTAADGLGPLFNARACQACHIKDARGHPPQGEGDAALSIVLRLSVPDPRGPDHGIPGHVATLPEPTYGGQLQDFAIQGHAAEGAFRVAYEEREVALSGGETASLRAPTYAVGDPAYGPLRPDALMSARVAPQMIGLGLLEAIPEADILAGADEEDADGDGISGRVPWVPSAEFGGTMLGRFGWKAAAPTLREQSAAAFAADMGLSTSLFMGGGGDCSEAQEACLLAPFGAPGGGPEVEDASLDLVTFYVRNLGVPARRGADDPQVLRGKEVFHEAGCAACHRPAFVTHRLRDRPEQSFQLVWPYTDLLLHDMGEGLADGRPEGRASGSEWRTAPLWGVALNAQVTGVESYLHDGRARTLLEAVLWHGGEAARARDAVVAMPPGDRAALLAFLGSL